jgi:hypothetical protein
MVAEVHVNSFRFSIQLYIFNQNSRNRECHRCINTRSVIGNAKEKALLNKSYVMRVWITAILIAPIIMLLILAFKENAEWSAGFISFYILMVFADLTFVSSSNLFAQACFP